jgi:hypothetical protein
MRKEWKMQRPVGGVRAWPRGRRIVLGVAATSALVLLAAPAMALAGRDRDEPELSRAEARRVERWWDLESRSAVVPVMDLPLDRLLQSVERALAAGVPRGALRTAVFSDAAWAIFASNRAGGEGRPSPYAEYFANNPVQLGRLGEYLRDNETYVVGPGGTQDQLFAEFQGLRDSYLASLGLVEVNGRIVDPRAPHLTPYFATRFLGPPRPLPQPSSALNVG